MERFRRIKFYLYAFSLVLLCSFSTLSLSQTAIESGKEEEDFQSLFTEAQSAVLEYYQSHKEWFEEKRQTQKRIYHLAEGILEVVKDKEVQKASMELVERFKFKPLILAEVLLLLLTLVLRSARSRKPRGFFKALMEHFFISIGYVFAAFILIPTIFLGTNYIYLAWTLTQRIYLLLQSGLGPTT